MWKTALKKFEVIWSTYADHITSNFLKPSSTNFRPAMLRWPRTLKGPKTLAGPRTLPWLRQLTDKANLFCKNNYYIEMQIDATDPNSDYSRDKTRYYHYQTQQFIFIWIMHMKNFDKMILLVFQKTSQTFYEIISMRKYIQHARNYAFTV